MKLGIMQPYFFPYVGYFSLIAHTERWIVFDITQYTPKSWISRNRVLHPEQGWIYISAPLENSSISLRISETRVKDVPAFAKSTLGKLSHYRKYAPNYQAVCELVNETFSRTPDNSLVSLNVTGLQVVCQYLGIPFNYDICSRLDLPLPDHMEPGAWAPTLCSLLGANSYLNPPGGQDLFDPHQFASLGVELNILQPISFEYATPGYQFEAGLSILDVMMWNSPEAIRDFITTQSQTVTIKA